VDIVEKIRRLQRYAQKWGIEDASYIKRFRFDEFYTKSQQDTFFRDLFSSPQVDGLVRYLKERMVS
jgi:hypothetical protein